MAEEQGGMNDSLGQIRRKEYTKDSFPFVICARKLGVRWGQTANLIRRT